MVSCENPKMRPITFCYGVWHIEDRRNVGDDWWIVVNILKLYSEEGRAGQLDIWTEVLGCDCQSVFLLLLPVQRPHSFQLAWNMGNQSEVYCIRTRGDTNM